MSDFGIAVSADGYDVKTCDDKDLVVTSKYNALKGNLSGEGSILVNDLGTNAIVTIPHGLGYIPMVQGVWSNTGTAYGMLPYFNLVGGTTQVFHQIQADATNVKIIFNVLDLFGTGATTTHYYKYFIFIDKGNLQ